MAERYFGFSYLLLSSSFEAMTALYKNLLLCLRFVFKAYFKTDCLHAEITLHLLYKLNSIFNVYSVTEKL